MNNRDFDDNLKMVNAVMACYTALPVIVINVNAWAAHTEKYRCSCQGRYQLVLAYNAYGYRCTECDLPADPRGLLNVFGPSFTHGSIST